MYAQARYYLPKIGRFAEEDSNKGNGYLPESLNYYVYCYNNPLNFVDLNGCYPVYLKYIVNKNNGKIEWDKKNEIATVIINGKTASFSTGSRIEDEVYGGSAIIIKSNIYKGYLEPQDYDNGKKESLMVVDSEDLRKAFGLTYYQSEHQPKEWFPYLNTAYKAYQMCPQGNTKINGLYGAALYRSDGGIKYSENIPYEDLLKMTSIDGNKIEAYVFGCCVNNYDKEEKLRLAHQYTNLPIYYKYNNSDKVIYGLNKENVNSKNSNIKMHISEKGLNFIADYEDFYSKPYRGQDFQNRTVGYGHVILEQEGNKYDNGITKEEALKLLKTDIIERENDVNYLIKKYNIQLNQNQFDSLVHAIIIHKI